MGRASRFEPDDCIYVDASSSLQEKLQQVSWYDFIKKFRGYNLEVSRQFAATFDGHGAVIGGFEFPVTQESIAEATSLPNLGEEWFKGKYNREAFTWHKFFRPNAPREIGKGLSCNLLKKKYKEPMLIIMQYVTCNGRFSLILAYHLRLLMVFEGQTLNMPFYFLKSLFKMAKTYQNELDHKLIFHHGLIFMLLLHELIKHHISWEKFLSKIQLDDATHVRCDSMQIDSDPLPSKEDTENSPDRSSGFMQQHSDEPKSSHDILMKDETDVNFTSKRQARLASRLTRNQVKKTDQTEFVELDSDNSPSSSAAQIILDLKNQVKHNSPETVKARNVSESHDKTAKSPICDSCLESNSHIQSLKDDISELHKEILKLKRQKRLLTENYELEISELNRRLKSNETEQRFTASGINIIINSEGQSSRCKDN